MVVVLTNICPLPKCILCLFIFKKTAIAKKEWLSETDEITKNSSHLWKYKVLLFDLHVVHKLVKLVNMATKVLQKKLQKFFEKIFIP